MDRDELYESDSINTVAEEQQEDSLGGQQEEGFPLLQSPISFSAVQGIVRSGARRLGLTTDESDQEQDSSSSTHSSEHSSSELTSQSSAASERNLSESSNNNNMSSPVVERRQKTLTRPSLMLLPLWSTSLAYLPGSLLTRMVRKRRVT